MGTLRACVTSAMHFYLVRNFGNLSALGGTRWLAFLDLAAG